MIDPFDSNQTIVAQATANESGYPRGIIRLSGPDTLPILQRSFSPVGETDLGECRIPSQFDGSFQTSLLSSSIPVSLLFWPNERSYTGQIAAEIHAPGSLPLLEAIIQQLCWNGARLARPGEFTMRAFLSGRLDLTEAEAVLGVIDARDQKHLNVALKQLSGGISRPIQQSRDSLLMVLAHLEAGLDFVEEDIEFVSAEEVLNQIGRCRSELEVLKSQIDSRDQQEVGLRVALFGQPNTGKSSLFNALVKRFSNNSETAIVSDVSGTTRDFIVSTLTIQGLNLQLVDTAGMDDDPNSEMGKTANTELKLNSPLAFGQDQSTRQERQADWTLFCLDSSRPLSKWETEQLAVENDKRIICLNKCDLPRRFELQTDAACISVSAMDGKGIDDLGNKLAELASASGTGETIPSTAIRCATAIDEALDSLQNAKEMVESSAGEELVAAEIRLALDAVGQVTGVVYTDDILDVVFKQFCIGK